MSARDPLERFEEKYVVNDETGCWEWTAVKNGPAGYGRFTFEGKKVLAHRWSYEHFVGEIPEGLVIDHICRVRHCVNPDHLRPATTKENLLADGSESLARLNAEKTSCPRGHAYTPENTKSHGMGRKCRACDREAATRRRSKLRAKVTLELLIFDHSYTRDGLKEAA